MGTGVQQWEIWEAPWPDQGGGTKLRPVLVLGEHSGPDGTTLWVACKITHSLAERGDRYTIAESDDEFELTGLDDTSHAYLTEIRRFEASEFKMRRGFLAEWMAEEIAAEMRRLLGQVRMDDDG